MSESGIQVSISPAQSAFFAGEPLSVTIKFLNVNVPSPAPGTSPRSASFVPAHRRGVQSVTEVPLAQPPTSPRTPRASDFPPNASPVNKTLNTGRKGHIGRPKPQFSPVPDSPADDRKKHMRRALSVSITPRALPTPLPFDPPLANALKQFESAQIDPALASCAWSFNSQTYRAIYSLNINSPHKNAAAFVGSRRLTPGSKITSSCPQKFCHGRRCLPRS